MDPLNVISFALAAAMAIKFLMRTYALEERVATLEFKAENAEDELSRLESELDCRA